MVSRTKKKNFFKISILTACVLLILLILVFGTNIFNVKHILITGNNHYTNEEILETAKISTNINVFKVNKKNSISQLTKLPYINEITIKKKLPDSITINIVESEPIGYVPFNGTYLLINKNGKVLDKLRNESTIKLPIIEGIVFKKFKMGEVLDIENESHITSAVEISNLLKKYNLTNTKTHIDVGNLNQIRLYIEELDVIIGEMNHINKKIQWLSEVITQYNIGVLDLSNVHKGQAVMSPLI